MPYVRLLAPTRRVHLRALQGVRQVRLFLHRGFLDGWLLLLPWLRLVCLGAGLRRSLRSIIAITLMWASERAWTGAGEWARATSPVAAAASAAAAHFSPRRRKNAPPLFLVIALHAWRSGRGGGGSAVAAAATQPPFTLPCRRTSRHIERLLCGISRSMVGRHAGIKAPRLFGPTVMPRAFPILSYGMFLG